MTVLIAAIIDLTNNTNENLLFIGYDYILNKNDIDDLTLLPTEIENKN